VAAVVATLVVAVSRPSQASDASSEFKASGVDGAGFQNVIAVDPAGSGLVLAGGDISGIHRSTDWGRTWSTANRGLWELPHRSVAALAFSPSTPGKAYAAVGWQGNGGGLFVSLDGGQSWERRSDIPQFSGANNAGITGVPGVHPRSTGNLLAVDDTGGFLYAATFNQGVMRSSDDGRTWTTLGLPGLFLRSLAWDPQSSGTLYASAYGRRIYKTTSARTSGTFVRLAGAPITVEELAIADGTLYAAAGRAGVYSSGDGGLTWTRLGAADLRDDGPVWTAVHATRDPSTGSHVVIVAADAATPSDAGTVHSVFRSTDGGATWTSLTGDPARIQTSTGGPDGPTWWFSRTQRWMMLGAGQYTPAQVVADRANPSRLYVAGRAGVWGTSDAGTTWYPMVRGLGVTLNRAVVADPNVPGRVLVANTDWIVLSSDDGLATVRQVRPPTGGTAGFALALDTATTPSTVYAAVGERDTNTRGEIFSSRDPAAGWTKEGLSGATGGKRPLGVVVQRVNGAPVILAAVEGGGIWRKSAGTWKQVSTAAMGPQTTSGASFAWPAGSSTVLLYDRESGVWRSTNNGATWALIWSRPSPDEMGGSLAVDPTNQSRVYVSVADDGVYRLDAADIGTVDDGAIIPVKVAPFRKPGPIVVSPSGHLMVTLPARQQTPATLMVSPDGGATWTVIQGDYADAALFPLGIAAGPEGNVYVSLFGNGVVVGRPDTSPPTADPTSPRPNDLLTGLSQSLEGTASDTGGVAAVRVAVLDRLTGDWLRTDGSWGRREDHDAVLTAPGATSTRWTHPFVAPGPGPYDLHATAVDNAGNVAVPVVVPFDLRTPDTTAPVPTVATPTAGQVFHGTTITFAGTAADDQRVAGVRVAVMDRGTGLWLSADGTWGAFEQHEATVAPPGAASTAWSFRFSPPRSGLYGLRVRAHDANGLASASLFVPFEAQPDSIPPAVSVTTPGADDVSASMTVPVTGTATDDRTVASVSVAVQDRATALWRRADGSWGAFEQQPAALASPGAPVTTWTYTFAAPGSGRYAVWAKAFDAAGNGAPPAWVPFQVSTGP
jgi:hypothetical protein